MAGYILVALIVGAAVGFFLKKKEADRLLSQLDKEKQKALQLESCLNEEKNLHARDNRDFQEKQTVLQQMHEKELENLKRSCESELSNERRLHDKDVANLQLLREKQEEQWREQLKVMKAQFKELADEVLTDKTAAMKQSNNEQLQAILNPFRDKISELSETVQQSKKESAVNRESVEKTIAQLMQRASEIGQEADRLTAALKHSGKMQGDWGEVILERILEESGLRKGEEYFPQASYTNEEGRSERPDMIVQLPGQRKVIIDSKTSLTAYVNYVNATDDMQRAVSLKEHVASVKKHIDELAAKNYPRLLKGQAVDYVLMFIPNEGSYITAMQADAGLAFYAYRKNIILINPTNLMLSLKLVYSLWQSERQNRNVSTIIDKAEKLYNRFVEFSATFEKLDTGIENLRKLYDKGKGQLVTGRGNITRQLTDLKHCGVTPSKEFSAATLDQVSVDEQQELS